MIRLLLFILLTSCGASTVLLKPYAPPLFWEEDLTGFVEDFKEDAAFFNCPLNGLDLRRIEKVASSEDKYGETIEGKAGKCLIFELRKTPTEKRQVWGEIWIHEDVTGYLSLRDLMYHELAHCYLGLEHTKDSTDIMNERMSKKEKLEEIETDWEERKQKLFKSCTR